MIFVKCLINYVLKFNAVQIILTQYVRSLQFSWAALLASHYHPTSSTVKMQSFQDFKAKTLAKVDLSRKGAIDAPIADLVKEINLGDNFFTTSSCSGRISVFEFVSACGICYQADKLPPECFENISGNFRTTEKRLQVAFYISRRVLSLGRGIKLNKILKRWKMNIY